MHRKVGVEVGRNWKLPTNCIYLPEFLVSRLKTWNFITPLAYWNKSYEKAGYDSWLFRDWLFMNISLLNMREFSMKGSSCKNSFNDFHWEDMRQRGKKLQTSRTHTWERNWIGILKLFRQVCCSLLQRRIPEIWIKLWLLLSMLLKEQSTPAVSTSFNLFFYFERCWGGISNVETHCTPSVFKSGHHFPFR